MARFTRWRQETSVIDLESGIGRRQLLQWLALSPGAGLLGGLSACQQTPPIYDLAVSRDVGCSCCHVWTEVMQASGRFRVSMTDAPDLPALKRKLGVPASLGACHTAIVQGYVIEGHVPAEDILRLLAEHPAGVRGIAVPGMPRGSPGMEQSNGVVDDFTVVAFDANGVQTDFSYRAGSA